MKHRTWRNMLALVVGTVLMGPPSTTRDERGLSQSTENAILLAGAVTVAGIVITAVTLYVQARLPK